MSEAAAEELRERERSRAANRFAPMSKRLQAEQQQSRQNEVEDEEFYGEEEEEEDADALYEVS